jgi:single-stranded DNA-binding protein
MIDALIGGRLYGQPVERTGKSGKPFVTAKVRAAAGDGEVIFVNVIAFDRQACAALCALGDGDSVSLVGSLTPKVWTPDGGDPRPALDLVAHAVLSPYAVKRRRQAAESSSCDQDARGDNPE